MVHGRCCRCRSSFAVGARRGRPDAGAGRGSCRGWSPGSARGVRRASACSWATCCRRRTSCRCSARRWRCWPSSAGSSSRSTLSRTLQTIAKYTPAYGVGVLARAALLDDGVDARRGGQRRRLDGGVRRRRGVAVPPRTPPGSERGHTARREPPRPSDRGRPSSPPAPSWVGRGRRASARHARGSAGSGPPSGWSTWPSRSATAWQPPARRAGVIAARRARRVRRRLRHVLRLDARRAASGRRAAAAPCGRCSPAMVAAAGVAAPGARARTSLAGARLRRASPRR